MGKKKKGRTVKNNKQVAATEPEHFVRAPHSFVFHRGQVGKYIERLVRDFRKIMEPYTATNLKVRKKNTIRDLVNVSGLLHVSHMVMFTLTEISPYLRVARFPRGPTLTFKIHEYVLMSDVASSLRKQYNHPKMYINAPLIVMNGFSGDKEELKLMVSTFQGMFPTINITKVDLNAVKRCLLINYDQETKIIEIRHYAIRVTPVGLSKSVKKLKTTKLPNMSKFEDISEFIEKGDLLSESEAEDDPSGQIEAPQETRTKGNLPGNNSAIRLTELGPRLKLQLIKVEAGLMDGEVIYHEFIHKTEEEKAETEKKREAKRKLKLKRKMKQMENVKKKEDIKEELKNKSLQGMARKKQEWKTESDKLMHDAVQAGAQQVDDDDAEYFRKEVGSEPEPELFARSALKRKGEASNFKHYKKIKTDSQKTVRWKDENQDKNRNNDFKRKRDFDKGKFKGKGPKRKNNSAKGRGFTGSGKSQKRRLGTKVTKGKRH